MLSVIVHILLQELASLTNMYYVPGNMDCLIPDYSVTLFTFHQEYE
jgi:hypothetical protein